MNVENRECKNCGASDWREFEKAEKSYPDNPSRERSQTVRKVFICNNCDKEGRRFEDGHDGTITFAGALRA